MTKPRVAHWQTGRLADWQTIYMQRIEEVAAGKSRGLTVFAANDFSRFHSQINLRPRQTHSLPARWVW